MGDAPTTSEWSTILLPTEVCLILEVLRWYSKIIPVWVLSQYKEGLSRYRDSHYEDKTVVRPSYIYNWNSYNGKYNETDPCLTNQ